MMTAVQQIPLITVEQYLADELDGEERHEYIGGYVYAMAGAKTVHNQLSGTFYGALYGQLRGKTCQPFNSDMKVRIQMPTHTRFYYPDGMVVCEAVDPEKTFQDQPVVIAEVLSDSTRRTDMGEKREAYLSIPSLKVYLLIETDIPSVSVYRRANEGEGLTAFDTELYTKLSDVVPLGEVGAELPLGELYERVKFA